MSYSENDSKEKIDISYEEVISFKQMLIDLGNQINTANRHFWHLTESNFITKI